MTLTSKRLTRWDTEQPSLPVLDRRGAVLPPAIQATTMTAEQLEIYTDHFRVQELTTRLRMPDSELQRQTRPRRCRERSPEPEYDSMGRRTNTRLQRHRTSMEKERHELVAKLTGLVPNYQPPHDYRRRPARFSDRVFIPIHEFPGVSFIGQILGPRGSSIKTLQEESGAHIAIRGQGSVKEGRSAAAGNANDTRTKSPRRRGGLGQDNNNRNTNDHYHHQLPLHVLITADTQRKLDKAKTLVRQVIEDAGTKSDLHNERKMQQLRDVALANGTLRDDDEALLGRGRGRTARNRLITGPEEHGDDGSPAEKYCGSEGSGGQCDATTTTTTTTITTDAADFDEQCRLLMRDICPTA